MNTPALWAAFRLGVQKAWAEPMVMIGQCSIMWALIVSYGAMLPAIPASDLQRLHVTPVQLIWYMVTGELMVAFSTYHFRELQDDIHNGAIEGMMVRPVHFWQLKLAGWVGEDVARFFVALTPFCFFMGVVMSGTWLWSIGMLALYGVLAIGGGLIMGCAHLIIGCLALWLGDSRPVFWLWQKCVFLLGAMIWPLTFYPHWLQTMVWFTPFPAAVATVANLTLGQPALTTAWQIALQLAWVTIFLCLCWIAGKAVQRRLLYQGG